MSFINQTVLRTSIQHAHTHHNYEISDQDDRDFNWRKAKVTTVLVTEKETISGSVILETVHRSYSTIIHSIGEETYMRIQLFDD